MRSSALAGGVSSRITSGGSPSPFQAAIPSVTSLAEPTTEMLSGAIEHLGEALAVKADARDDEDANHASGIARPTRCGSEATMPQ